MPDDPADLRENYTQAGLSRADLHPNPMTQFQTWFDQALDAQIPEPNAMTLATLSPDGHPTTRTVLLKGITTDALHFYTNLTSRKARDIEAHPHIALTILWKELERQVSIRGTATTLDRATTESYFHSRPRSSQIGAWVSKQSQEIPNRTWLETREQEITHKFANQPIPLPDFWGGFQIKPKTIEFWQGRPSRLHDRHEYYRPTPTAPWKTRRLSP